MAFLDVVTFFRDEFEALNFDEWPEPFSADNIPDTIYDRAFNIEVGAITGGAANQRAHDFFMDVTVRVYFKGFRDSFEARDESLTELDTIYTAILAPAKRIGSVIKDVVPNTAQPVRQSETQDNNTVLELSFTVSLIQCY